MSGSIISHWIALCWGVNHIACCCICILNIMDDWQCINIGIVTVFFRFIVKQWQLYVNPWYRSKQELISENSNTVHWNKCFIQHTANSLNSKYVLFIFPRDSWEWQFQNLIFPELEVRQTITTRVTLASFWHYWDLESHLSGHPRTHIYCVFKTWGLKGALGAQFCFKGLPT